MVWGAASGSVPFLCAIKNSLDRITLRRRGILYRWSTLLKAENPANRIFCRMAEAVKQRYKIYRGKAAKI